MKLTTNDSTNGTDERNRRFEAAWRELPARYREVIRLHYWEKCSHEEVGHRLGVSLDAAKHLHRRAMRNLADGATRAQRAASKDQFRRLMNIEEELFH